MKIENNVITILNIEVIFLSKYISSGFDIIIMKINMNIPIIIPNTPFNFFVSFNTLPRLDHL